MTMHTVSRTLVAGLIVTLFLVGAVPPGAPVHAQTTGTGIDIAIVLDDSASTKGDWTARDGNGFPPTDPKSLRYSAAKLLVQLLAKDDRVFLVTFGSQVQALVDEEKDCRASIRAQVESLSGCEMQSISGYQGVKDIVDEIRPPSLENQGTRIDLGYALASHVLRANHEDGRPQFILFLTDGYPTQSHGEGKQGDQRGYVKAQAENDRELGIFTYAIGLCSADAGCHHLDEKLMENMAGSARRNIRAKRAKDLVRIFSDILSDLKPGYYVTEMPPNDDGNPELWTREDQGVIGLNIVLAGDLSEFRCDHEPVWRAGQGPGPGRQSWDFRDFDDENIRLLSFNSQEPLVGRPWEACTVGAAPGEAFAVVRSSTLPVIAFPPPVVARDPAASHYFLPGKDLLLMAQVLRSGSPVAGQTVTSSIGGSGAKPLSASLSRQGFYYGAELVPPGDEFDVTLRVGSDLRPLLLERKYNLRAASDLPGLHVVSPTDTDLALIDGTHARLAASMPSGRGVTDLTVDAYVLDVTSPDDAVAYYEARLACTGLDCADDGFAPQHGRVYTIYFVASARHKDRWYGDWAKANLSTSPKVLIDGLPEVLDVLAMPEYGWPITISALSPKSLGRLQARLTLERISDAAEITDVKVPFSIDLAHGGQRTTVLNFTGLDKLTADAYTGDLEFFLDGGAHADVLPRSRPVSFDFSHLAADLQLPSLDFAPVTYWLQGETPPEVGALSLPLEFESQPFRIFASDMSYESVECQEIDLRVLPPEQTEGGAYQMPIQALLPGHLPPGICKGEIELATTLPYATLKPNSKIDWSLRVEVPISIEMGELLKFDDVHDVGDESTREIPVHMPVRHYPLDVFLETHERGGEHLLPDGSLLVTAGNCERNRKGDCDLPVTLKLASMVPADLYTGDIVIRVPGVEEPEWRQPFEERRPTQLQRLVTFFKLEVLPWIILVPPGGGISIKCCIPWSMLFLLVVLLVLRRHRRAVRDADEKRRRSRSATAKEPATAGPESYVDDSDVQPGAPAQYAADEEDWNTSEEPVADDQDSWGWFDQPAADSQDGWNRSDESSTGDQGGWDWGDEASSGAGYSGGDLSSPNVSDSPGEREAGGAWDGPSPSTEDTSGWEEGFGWG